MIDCSDTEALAIDLAFKDSPVNILYCYWHLWEAWDVNIKKKVSYFYYYLYSKFRAICTNFVDCCQNQGP
jgi:hypothetical protein